MTQATPGSIEQILKTGARRTVTREVVDGTSRIVKRFHAPGLFDRTRDRRRALREHDALARLWAQGLPVPRPVALRRREGRWELVLEDLGAAVSLDDALEGRVPWPAPPLRIAASLGKLLADLVAGDVRHGDLHAGNVLVDEQARVYLIDLAYVRIGVQVAATPLLVGCAAGLRERDPAGFRARALAAFRRASGLALDADTLEHQARERRKKVVSRRVARYWRESGALRLVEAGGVRGLLAHDLAEERLAELDRDDPPQGYVAVRATSLQHLARRWERAARCCMHRLPCERPVALIHAPRPRAVLEAPTLEPATARATSTALARTLGSIHDRGLRLEGQARDLGLAPDGSVWIGGGDLEPHPAIDDLGWVRAWFERLELRPDEAALAAFLGANRGTRRDGERIAKAWMNHG